MENPKIKPLAKLTMPGLPNNAKALRDATHQAIVEKSESLRAALAYQCRGDLGQMLLVLELMKLDCLLGVAGQVPHEALMILTRESNDNLASTLETALAAIEKEQSIVH